MERAQGLPTPQTAFIGRSRERAALGELVRAARLVTATGPGGIGKTRLCLAVAADVGPATGDGPVFVDLVTVTDDAMVVAAVAEAVGAPERPGRSRSEVLTEVLASSDRLIVLDNCEHVLGGVRDCVTELLAGCPSLRLLATSRIRLLLAGETVYVVPGLSLDDDDGGSDAVALFTERLAAGGATGEPSAADLAVITGICRRLDGMALAIELAAARAPSFGLDGIRRALTEGHDLLAVAHRADDRHGSLRATIDWSYRLLSDDQQAALRASAAFAAPFDLDAAAVVADRPPGELLAVLAALVDANLVVLRTGTPSRYRLLETIRQYGTDRSRELGALDEVGSRHLGWCRMVLEDLLRRAPGDADWCDEVDRHLDEARAALGWAAVQPARREGAADLAELIAAVSFQRGRAGEAQQRYEQAAELTGSPARRQRWLHLAGRSAMVHYLGDEASTLHERAAGAALDGGDRIGAARMLVEQALLLNRFTGTMRRLPTEQETVALRARAAELGRGVPLIEAALAVVDTCWLDGPGAVGPALDALAAVEPLGESLLVSATLDVVCSAQLADGDLDGAGRTMEERRAVMARLPIDAGSGIDHLDLHFMGVHVDIARGRLLAGREHASALATLPFLRDELHVGLAPRIEIDTLAGRFDDVLDGAGIFLASWERAGRPRVNNFGAAVHAVALMQGLRHDDDERRRWIAITRTVTRDRDAVDDPTLVWPAVLDGILHLDRDDPEAALSRLRIDPDVLAERSGWYQRVWLPWYAAAWAEASALVDGTGVEERLDRAARLAGGNEIAELVVLRARRLVDESRADLGDLATRFDHLGCAREADRTRRLGGTADARTSGAEGHPGSFGLLTDREVEVLGLVAAGLSNPQIGAALYISRKTAEHHVSSILAKLGVTSRAEAAAVAARSGLPGTPRPDHRPG